MTKKEWFWEIIGYVGLALCVFGQIAVGYWYLIAQIAYLIANLGNTIRCFALHQPNADKVRNCVFLGITVALIVIWLVK